MTPRVGKAIFFGTPDFAVPSLEALHGLADVRLVVTQPDRPAGRGHRLTPPPVKMWAAAHGLSVTQPAKVRTPDFAEFIRSTEAEVAVVVAYGRILPGPLLRSLPHGFVNVHASVLPRWRGAAPIAWAIATGDRTTGVSLMKLDEGLDTGPVIATSESPIDPDETARELTVRLSRLGAQLLEENLPRYLAGQAELRPQDDTLATIAPLLAKENGRIDWSQSARHVHDHVRGMNPWPGAFSDFDGQPLKIHRTTVEAEDGRRGAPGEVLRCSAQSGIEVACGTGIAVIREVQPSGKRRMTVAEFLAGHVCKPGAHFGRAVAREDLHEDRR